MLRLLNILQRYVTLSAAYFCFCSYFAFLCSSSCKMEQGCIWVRDNTEQCQDNSQCAVWACLQNEMSGRNRLCVCLCWIWRERVEGKTIHPYLFTIPNYSLTIHRCFFTIHHNSFTIHHYLFTIHHYFLTTHLNPIIR